MKNEITEKQIFEAFRTEYHDATEMTTEELDQHLLPEFKRAWLKYMWLKGYLRKEGKLGKTEFRLVINQDRTAMIHPLGKDGETLDFEL